MAGLKEVWDLLYDESILRVGGYGNLVAEGRGEVSQFEELKHSLGRLVVAPPRDKVNDVLYAPAVGY